MASLSRLGANNSDSLSSLPPSTTMSASPTSAGGVSIAFGEGSFEEKLAAAPDVPAASEPNQGEALSLAAAASLLCFNVVW